MDDQSATTPPLDDRSRELRAEIVRTLGAAGRGHVGSSFSLVEILRVLYDDVMRYNPADPGWPERDRFILSKGHGCLALYVLLAQKGFFPKQALTGFCSEGGILGGHPDASKIPGVEAASGSLGHGAAIAVGLALGMRMKNIRSRVFVVQGDGESNEGSVWEAALLAGKHNLSNLTVIVDYNKQQSFGSTREVQDLEPFADKWRAFGFAATECDGHDLGALRNVFSSLPLDPCKPSAVICHTVKGKGIAFCEGNLNWHHKSRISAEDVARLLCGLGVQDA